MRIHYRLSILAVLLLAAGCGGDNRGRLAIEGTVNYAGKPVEEGQIIFEPTMPNQPQAVAQIASGSYKMDAKFGPVIGSYKVRVDGYRMKVDPNVKLPPYLADSGQQAMVREQIVPLKYKTEPLLTVEIVEGTSTYPFDIQK